MIHPVERMLAWRYLRARRGFISLTTWFAIIGILLGVATLILVTSLMNGIREEMTSRFIGLDGHVAIYSPYRAFHDYRDAIALLRNHEGVASATPKVEGQVMVTANGIALGAQVMAIPYDTLSTREIYTTHVSHGSLTGLETGEGIVLGEQLAQRLRVSVGEGVTLISPQGQSTIAGFIPRMKAYPVIATLKLGVHQLDSSLILMPFEEAQVYFKLMTPEGDAVSNLEVVVEDPGDAPRVAESIGQVLPGARILTWQQSNAQVFAALNVQRNVMVVILALIILVAAFNIISCLVMLVKEKRRDIAILRSMGATRANVMKVFMLAGTSIGLVGTAAGVMLGLFLAANIEGVRKLVETITGQPLLVEDIYFLSTLPTKTNLIEVLVIIALALVLSFLATIYPARRAAGLDPAEALRYE